MKILPFDIKLYNVLIPINTYNSMYAFMSEELFNKLYSELKHQLDDQLNKIEIVIYSQSIDSQLYNLNQ